MKATKQKLYRQGDVLFCAIDQIPAGKRAKRENGVVAYGEVTGHKHALADLTTAEVLEIGDGLFVHVSEEGLSIEGDPGATFVHEEHGPISLPPGDYRIQIQREYSPEEIRNVID
jgi:hypothetical protein